MLKAAITPTKLFSFCDIVEKYELGGFYRFVE